MVRRVQPPSGTSEQRSIMTAHQFPIRRLNLTGGFASSVSFRCVRCDDREYDRWLDVLTEMSARLDVLQAAVTELRHRCESEYMHSEHVLEVLNRHGA